MRVFEAECIVGIAGIGTTLAFVLFEGREKLVPFGLVGEGRRRGHGRGLGGRFRGQRGSGIGKLPEKRGLLERELSLFGGFKNNNNNNKQ